MATERTSKTNSKQQKPNKPASHQADQNIAKPPGQQPRSPQLPTGQAAGAEPYDQILLNQLINSSTLNGP